MNGGKIDHRTAACFLHIGQRALGAENVTAYVDGKQFVEVVGRDIGNRARLGQAGVVDEHVEAAEMVGGGFYDVCAKFGGLGEVALHGSCRSSGGANLGNGSGCAFVAVGVVADDGCAAAGQFEGDALADAAVIDSGNECFLAGQRILIAQFTAPLCVRSSGRRDLEEPFRPRLSFRNMLMVYSPVA